MPKPQPLPPAVAAQYTAPAPAAPAPTPAPTVKPAASRSPLAAMTEQEFVAWQSATVAALLDVQSRTTAYLARRSLRGTRTSTDIAMERDLILYADLLDLLGELKIEYDLLLVSGFSGGTGPQLSYDASQGASFTPPDPDDQDDDDDTIDFYQSPKAQPKP